MDINKKVSKVILAVLIVAQVCTLIYLFQFKKDGFHSDDSYDYGFANANHEQWIDKDGGRLKNFNQWESGEVFRDFIEVQKGHEFDYETALYNMSDDYIPPIYSLMLHTVCSFFPDTFSWWYGFGLNIIAFIIMILFIYKSIYAIVENRIISLLGCAFFGFTNAAINMSLFLKGYIFLAAITVAILYLHTIVWNKKDNCMKEMILISVLYVIGFLINYEMYCFGLCMTAVCGIFFLSRKKVRLSLNYGVMIIIAVLVAVILWPRTLEMFNTNTVSVYGKNMPLAWEINFCTLLLSAESLGIPVQVPDIVFWTYVKWILLYAVIIIGLLCFLLRNETFFKKIKGKTKHSLVICKQKIASFMDKSSIMCLLMLPVVFLTVIFVAFICNIYMMGEFADRYVFFLEPLLFISIYSLVYYIIKKIVKSEKVQKGFVAILLVILMISNHWILGGFYYFPTEYGKEPLVKATEDANVIVVTGLGARLIYYSTAIRECDNFLALWEGEEVDSCVPQDVEKEKCQADYLLIETAELRDENWISTYDASGEEILTAEQKLKRKYKLSDITNEYIKRGFATKAEKVMEIRCQYGKLALIKLN